MSESELPEGSSDAPASEASSELERIEVCVKELIDEMRREVESVGAVRADVKAMRLDFSSLVGGANEWCVRMRDELFARIDALARAAEVPRQAPPNGEDVAGGEGGVLEALGELHTEVKAMTSALLDLQREVRRLARQGKGPALRRGQEGMDTTGHARLTYEELIERLVTGNFEQE